MIFGDGLFFRCPCGGSHFEFKQVKPDGVHTVCVDCKRNYILQTENLFCRTVNEVTEYLE